MTKNLILQLSKLDILTIFFMQACPSENCNKKLVDLANGQFRCEKCSQETPNYKWRMILSVSLCVLQRYLSGRTFTLKYIYIP